MTKIQGTQTHTTTGPDPEIDADFHTSPRLFDSFLGVANGAKDLVEKATSPLTFSPTMAEFDSAIDVLRDTTIGKWAPGLVALDDLTDGLLAAQDYFVEQGKNPLDVLSGMPEAAERVLSRTNDLIREVRGDHGIELTMKPTEMDFAKTAEILIDEGSRNEYLVSIAALTIETLAENSPHIQRLADSNIVEFLDKASTVAGHVGDAMLMSAVVMAGPLGVFAVASSRPASSAVEMGKDLLKTVSNAEDARVIFNLTSGPSAKLLRELSADETFVKHLKIKIEAAAGKGVGYEATIEAKSQKVGDRHVVTYTLDHELAVILGMSKGARVDGTSFAGGQKIVVGFSSESADFAARAMQGNPTGAFAEAIKHGLALKTLTTEGSTQFEAELGSLKLKSKHAVELDFADPALKYGVSAEARIKVGQEFLKVSTNPMIDSVDDLLSELTQPSLSGSVKVEGGFDIELDLDSPRFTAGLKVTAEKGDLKLEVGLEIDVDFVKAATSLGITVTELKSQLESKQLDPKSWWKALPDDIVELKVRVEGTESRGVGIDATFLRGKAVIEKKSIFEIPATEGQADIAQILAQVRAEVTKGDLLNRPLRG